MPLKATKQNSNNTELDEMRVQWPITVNKVLAITTSRNSFTSESTSSDAITNESNVKKTNNTFPSFDYFNLGTHVGDNPTEVANNRNQLLTIFPEQTDIQWLEQVHGNTVAYIDTHHPKAITADAVITARAKLALAVMTADCLPILLTNSSGSEIAAIHGGWRSLAQNIIQETVAKMRLSAREDIIAWLGPCIGPEYFEVGQEVFDAFVSQDSSFLSAFMEARGCEGKYYANLQQIASLQLAQLGITSISKLAHCTYQRSQRYYSYRREQKTGRMASVICICA